MKNQSGTIKTNQELDRVVMGGSGGYRRLPGGSDDFSLQTELHHNIYIIIILNESFSTSLRTSATCQERYIPLTEWCCLCTQD